MKTLKLLRANQWHLIDLKRAGHSPRRTELRIDNEGQPLSLRFIPPTSFGSSAALCAESEGSYGHRMSARLGGSS